MQSIGCNTPSVTLRAAKATKITAQILASPFGGQFPHGVGELSPKVTKGDGRRSGWRGAKRRDGEGFAVIPYNPTGTRVDVGIDPYAHAIDYRNHRFITTKKQPVW